MKRPNKPRPSNQLRIIGGEWRSRRLTFPDQDGLRPTGERLRETLFNWLMNDLYGARCLDLFAGSGALGLEALSRGARDCAFVEYSTIAAKQLKANLDTLGCTNGHVHESDAIHYLSERNSGDSKEPFDVVFLDPPFAKNLWQPALDQLNSGLLSERAMVYIESPANTPMTVPDQWSLYRSKKVGDIQAKLYEVG